MRKAGREAVKAASSGLEDELDEVVMWWCNAPRVVTRPRERICWIWHANSARVIRHVGG